jgi:hypothetical protein
MVSAQVAAAAAPKPATHTTVARHASSAGPATANPTSPARKPARSHLPAARADLKPARRANVRAAAALWADLCVSYVASRDAEAGRTRDLGAVYVKAYTERVAALQKRQDGLDRLAVLMPRAQQLLRDERDRQISAIKSEDDFISLGNAIWRL